MVLINRAYKISLYLLCILFFSLVYFGVRIIKLVYSFFFQTTSYVRYKKFYGLIYNKKSDSKIYLLFYI